MTLPAAHENAHEDPADVSVGELLGMPVVRVNRTTSFSSGRELAATIVEALDKFAPNHVHPHYTDGYDD